MNALRINDFNTEFAVKNKEDASSRIKQASERSWSRLAPFWPLKSLIATNPLMGFDELPFDQALREGEILFQFKDLPKEMTEINRESIKWLKAYYDYGQASIRIPGREHGLLFCFLDLVEFDGIINLKRHPLRDWFENISHDPKNLILECLAQLDISEASEDSFLTLMLTTLPGWASHVVYRDGWVDICEDLTAVPSSKLEYLAFRVLLTTLMWPGANELIQWSDNRRRSIINSGSFENIVLREKVFEEQLLSSLSKAPSMINIEAVDVQLVFCIDVRSEPFRKSLEEFGNYETIGFAGFFGLPIARRDMVSDESFSCCPVLIKPSFTVSDEPVDCLEEVKKGPSRLKSIKRIYQSLKYSFTTPFVLIELMGAFNGLWMIVKSICPNLASGLYSRIKAGLNLEYEKRPVLEDISIEDRVSFAYNSLKMMGISSRLSKLVVFLGHGSQTENNSFASSLDCGACAGHKGGFNAKILAGILNSRDVRLELVKKGVFIEEDTYFLAGEHNTTTDEVVLFDQEAPDNQLTRINNLRFSLSLARRNNCLTRLSKLGADVKADKATKVSIKNSISWSEVRPEWGLAGNAAFIIGPRALTKNVDLRGRAFLHSYNWESDLDGSILTTIMTAPLVVGHWINSQYLFSTIDNATYGAGSKITKNLTGKFAVMQGNASDLMTGLPLQSVYETDSKPYHEPVRLHAVVYAPRDSVESIIRKEAILTKLFSNSWLHLFCIDPKLNQSFKLNSDLTWKPLYEQNECL